MEADPDSLVQALKGATGHSSRILSIVRKAERTLKGSQLCAIFGAAIEAYKCPKAAEDVAYRELCVKYMLQLCVLDVNEAREFHNRQRAFGITSDARMYEARASLEEREGDSAKALKILQEGLRIGARPGDLLKRQIAALQSRSQATEWMTAQQERAPAPAPSAGGVTCSEGSPGERERGTLCEDCATQTQIQNVAASTQTEGPDSDGSGSARRHALSAAQLCTQLWQKLQRQRRDLEVHRGLLDVFGAWRHLREAAMQQRREGLFEALRRQVQRAQQVTRAAELGRTQGQQVLQLAWLRVALRAWGGAAAGTRQLGRWARWAYGRQLRRRMAHVLHAWHLRIEPIGVREMARETSLEGLLADLAPDLSLSRRTEEPAGKPSLRPPLVNVSNRSAEEDSKRVRGPERFFYDTSSYTGCARYGGPMVVDKKENAVCPRSPVMRRVSKR
ncbi:unnamed protein product [Effrenium voratum]|uniref:Uncharacterized protein n=1 Tax=Effrenium voratum TaxID=2562239 RepID=A0AA36NDZ8_9DINO|nr:unnamed protein product [Effrenium voratum]CAJ1441303.1 unnamed protein product [Effrenium voratum]